MTRALPTINVEDFASDELGAVQVHDRVGDVIDLAHVPDRVQCAQGGVGFFAVHRGLDDAGRYCVHPNAALGVFDGQGAGCRVQAAFGQ